MITGDKKLGEKLEDTSKNISLFN